MATDPAGPSDQIRIDKLRAYGVIGLHHPERDHPQEILVSVCLSVDLREAAAADSIQNAVNYSEISRSILDHAKHAERFTIETLATDIAGLCLGSGRVKNVWVRISKPAADRAAEAVAVEVTRTQADLVAPALIGIGSNLSADANLKLAVEKMAAIGRVVAVSAVYQSPAEAPAANGYLNAVARVETCLPAAEVRRLLKRIEVEMGRTGDSKPSARMPIDLDLCMLGAQVIAAKDVTIPHEDLITREYLARGCAEVLPDGVHPITKEPLADVAKRLTGTMKLIERPDVALPVVRGKAMG